MKRSDKELEAEINKIFETDYYRRKFKEIVRQADPNCPLCDGWGWGQALSIPTQKVIRFCCCLQVNKITEGVE